MHKYLACEEEKAGVEITNLKLLEDQLRNIGNYINQQKEYADKSMENKRLRTLVRIGKVVDLDELPLPHERNPAVKPDTSPNAKSDISSKPGDGELPPIPGNHKQTSSKNESDTATPKEEITSHSKKEKTGATTSNKEVQKTDKDLEKTPSIKTDAKTIAAKKAEVKPATKSDSDKPAFTAPPENEHKLAEFIERLSKMTWAERRRNFQEEPANLYNYYNTLSDEARDNLIYEETQFYFEKFLPIKQVFLKANSHLPPEESKKHLEILAAILTPTQPKNWPTVGSFKEPSPSVIKGLTEWVDQTVNKFKSDPGLKSSGDFITAGTELKKRSASLKKAIQDFKSVQRSNPRDLKTKRILRDEFHQLKTIREDVENLLKAKGKSDPIK
ncbi:MAG: hypothetical protein ABIQ95_08515, partial [Bdellovibrionia bacterium]